MTAAERLAVLDVLAALGDATRGLTAVLVSDADADRLAARPKPGPVPR